MVRCNAQTFLHSRKLARNVNALYTTSTSTAIQVKSNAQQPWQEVSKRLCSIFSEAVTLEQHFLIWGKFTRGGKFPRFRG